MKKEVREIGVLVIPAEIIKSYQDERKVRFSERNRILEERISELTRHKDQLLAKKAGFLKERSERSGVKDKEIEVLERELRDLTVEAQKFNGKISLIKTSINMDNLTMSCGLENKIAEKNKEIERLRQEIGFSQKFRKEQEEIIREKKTEDILKEKYEGLKSEMEKLKEKLRTVQEETQARIQDFKEQDWKYNAIKEKCRTLGLQVRKAGPESYASLDLFQSDRQVNTLPSIHQKALPFAITSHTPKLKRNKPSNKFSEENYEKLTQEFNELNEKYKMAKKGENNEKILDFLAKIRIVESEINVKKIKLKELEKETSAVSSQLKVYQRNIINSLN